MTIVACNPPIDNPRPHRRYVPTHDNLAVEIGEAATSDLTISMGGLDSWDDVQRPYLLAALPDPASAWRKRSSRE